MSTERGKLGRGGGSGDGDRRSETWICGSVKQE